MMSTRKIKPSPPHSPTQTQTHTPAFQTLPTVPRASTTAHPVQGSWKDFYTLDFSAVHLPVDELPSEFLIFGNLPVSPLDKDLPPVLTILQPGAPPSYGLVRICNTLSM